MLLRSCNVQYRMQPVRLLPGGSRTLGARPGHEHDLACSASLRACRAACCANRYVGWALRSLRTYEKYAFAGS